ncbi:MAG: redoxin domain-containing protein [Candidatus Moraniibacteriota bacterium]|nr:MAG: redoxin domain-containing protein [Candidatus Moranbacteria bacterium]
MEQINNNRHPVIGEKIEDLSFEVFQNNRISKKKISDFKDKWLIIFFYPADFTFICPTELEDLAENYKDFVKEGAEIVSFSTDTAFVHKAWHDNSPSIKKITYPMGADPTAQIAKYFGIYIPEEGLALRGTFIIDPKGVLKAYEVNDNSIGRNAEELLRKLRASIYVSKHKGEVCPARWTPGKKTLKPGVDLVGKI